MIFITGDTHGDIDINKLSNKNWETGKSLSRNDYLIILGDFGLPFLDSDVSDDVLTSTELESRRKTYLYWTKWLSERPYTVLWIDGNHDNHSFWSKQNEVLWNGGMVNIHPDAENVIHLKRGEYYTIDGNTFWVMGGAKSVDRAYRVLGHTWWEEEIPSIEEMEHGVSVLQEHHNKVDYILTHTMPDVTIPSVLGCHYNDSEPTRAYLNMIYRDIDFKYWFCGHFHVDVRNDMYKMQVLYDDIVNLEDY